jgi:signal transduction histidine kinase
MKLTRRFVVLVVTLLAAVAVSASAGLHALGGLDSALSGIVSNDMERVFAITHARRLLRSLSVQERDFILSKDAAERATIDVTMSGLTGQLAKQLNAYVALMPQADAAALQTLRAAAVRWLALDRRVRELAASSPDAALALAKQHKLDPQPWEKTIEGLVALSEKRLAAQVSQAHAVYLSARTTLLWISALAGLVAAGLGGLIFAGIRRNLLEVIDLNQNLETLVKVRTEALTQRERALRLVLDNTGDGLFEAGCDGLLDGDCSAAALRWFGPCVTGRRLADYLYPDDAAQAGMFSAAFEQLVEDVLPFELCQEQMPRRLQRGSSILELEYKRVCRGEELVKILIVARDVTSAVEGERFEKNAREQQGLIGRLLNDKSGFAQFVKECEGLIAALTSEQQLAAAKRTLHTLKGNAGLYGLVTLAEFCHGVEERVAESGELPSAIDVASVAALWRAGMQSIETFLSEFAPTRLEVEQVDHQRLIESLLNRQDYLEILGMVELWTWPRTAEPLSRFRAHAIGLAKRLGKSIEVVLEHNEVRVPPDYLESFWQSFIHLVRNAIDHGVEAAETRVAAGKPPVAKIVFATLQTAAEFIVEVRDDGPGVDREALLRGAKQRGVVVASDVALSELVMMDGLSSRAEVSETSGRGFGLGAVRHACESAGGKVEVLSMSGRGTTFRFSFKRAILQPGALAARLERRWSLRPLEPANDTTAELCGELEHAPSRA